VKNTVGQVVLAVQSFNLSTLLKFFPTTFFQSTFPLPWLHILEAEKWTKEKNIKKDFAISKGAIKSSQAQPPSLYKHKYHF